MPKYVLLRKIGSDVTVDADRHEENENGRELKLFRGRELVGKFETRNYSGWYAEEATSPSELPSSV